MKRFALLTLAGTLALAACGGNDDDADDAGATAAVVTIRDNTFETREVTIGDPISVVNEDGTAHTVTADDGSFDVEVAANSSGETSAPDQPGDYNFHCEIHPSMTGVLIVR